MLGTVTPDRTPAAPRADVAALISVVERWAADLALGEEPAAFVAALEAAAPPEERGD